MKKKSHGFIAAPLIGTIIFLTAIVFIVNINKAETNNVARLASDAYHNRITSIVELYRGDSGSMFREDLRKVIETALTSECWHNFIIKSDATASMTKQEKIDKLIDARFNTCKNTLEIIHAVICSNSGSAVSQQCIDQNKAAGMPEPDAFNACRAELNNAGQREYGLQNWLNNINDAFHFEGIELSPTEESRRAFMQNYQVNPGDDGAGYRQYGEICRALISNVNIDCNAFANNYDKPDAEKFKCCATQTTKDQACPAQDVLPGCDSGTFYVKVKPSAVYDTLPRIQADAGQGNLLIAGALSDQEQFYLMINFPITKYYDRAYAFYQTIAYGQTGPTEGERPDAGIYGVLDGACYAGDYCQNHPPDALIDEFFGSNGDLHFPADPDARKPIANQVYDDLILPAAQNALSQDPQLKLQFTLPGVDNLIFTSDANGQVTGNKDDLVDKRLKALITETPTDSGALSNFFAQINLIDSDPRFKVDKNKPNQFCVITQATYKPR